MKRSLMNGVYLGVMLAPLVAAIHWVADVFAESDLLYAIDQTQSADELHELLAREGLLA